MLLERKTKLSKMVLKLLGRVSQPLSINQLLELLSNEQLSPNKTTLYRMMDKLIDNNAVAMITRSNGASYFELINHGHVSKHNHKHHGGHHHHFFCNNCDVVKCLDSCFMEKNNIDLNKLLPNKKFMIENHDFNLYGTCDLCNSKAG